MPATSTTIHTPATSRLRRVVLTLAVLALVYAALVAAMFVVMCQPPERFNKVMARMPGPAFMILPFEPLWNIARGGSLRVGDAAPDFDLTTADRRARVQLSAFRGKQPVVLVFGSYT